MSLNRYLFGKTIKVVYKKCVLKECIRSYFLNGSIFCLSIYVSVSKPSICVWKQIISVKWRNKLRINMLWINNINFDRSEKGCMLPTALGFLGDIGHCFVGGPRIFPRVAATMISKRFVKLGIIVYFWIL